MDNYEIAALIYGLCDMSVASELPKEEAIESIVSELNNCPTVKYYIENGFENTIKIESKIKTDLINLLDHECEVFDPICDGPVEHAEGMAMARDFVEKYFTERGF